MNDRRSPETARPLYAQLKQRFEAFSRWAELDRAVFLGIADRTWALASAPITILLITAHFTPKIQGYYYTFSSLLALQIFGELGLGQVIIQFASHEWAKLRFEKGEITGDEEARGRLISLGRFATRWFAVSGVLVTGVVMTVGFLLFGQKHDAGVTWVAPWLAISLLTGLNVQLIGWWSVLEGCNQVAEVYAYRFRRGIICNLAAWIGIAAGAGLWVAAVANSVGWAFSLAWLMRRHKPFLRLFFSAKPAASIDWRQELWPLQWRIALSWASGYLVFSLFTPVLFHYHGPVLAGQMGLTWSVITAVAGVSAMWVSVKAPRFGILIAQRDYRALDDLARRVGIASICVLICGMALIGVAVFALYGSGSRYAVRLLPPLPTAFLLAATSLSGATVPLSVYLRAHKREPFLWLSIGMGAAVAASTLLLGRYYGATGVSAGYLLITAGAVPVAVFIWWRCRGAWHGR